MSLDDENYNYYADEFEELFEEDSLLTVVGTGDDAGFDLQQSPSNVQTTPRLVTTYHDNISHHHLRHYCPLLSFYYLPLFL